MNIIYAIESRLWIVFTICYSYQIFYMVYMLLFKRSLSERFINRDPVMHKIAVVISARNESAVIGQLIESIHAQTYPAELIRIYVCADTCTDDTAEVARAAGATVFERQNRHLVGKGYALDAACEAPLKYYFARRQAADAGKNGNGRMARNVVERAILNQSKRLVADPDASLELLLPGDFDLDED